MNVAAETLAAYAQWAPLYPPVAHNPLMRAEQSAMSKHWPEVLGRRTLDLACGSGRYSRLLNEGGAAQVVALDFCLPMLQQVSAGAKVCASMMHLPFAADTFDVAISGLALGHAADIHGWMAEISRVLRKGGVLLYSDFHPEAARAGLTRSFKNLDEQTYSVPHRYFDVATQLQAAQAAALTVELVHDVRVGEELREAFPKSEDFYRQWDGLPIVLVVRVRK
ncbi:MAG: class I SAM-dependent methyltransferase [Pseudomonadota bacterium]|nr:class I SAM-dependent methyltransferase [Pseudomonadota bacterium]